MQYNDEASIPLRLYYKQLDRTTIEHIRANPNLPLSEILKRHGKAQNTVARFVQSRPIIANWHRPNSKFRLEV